MAKEAKDNTQVEEVELDDKALGVITEKVSEKLLPEIEKSNKDLVDAVVAKLEPTVKKPVLDAADNKAIEAARATFGSVIGKSSKQIRKELRQILKTHESPLAKESPELRFAKTMRALADGDLFTLRRYNRFALDLRQKVGYNNEGTAADGSVIVPDPYFDTEVYDNLPKYGVAFSDADVRTITQNAVYAISLDSGLSMYELAEAAVKTGAKLAFSRKTTTLRKFAVIVPATDELTEDAAIDYWVLVTREVSRAYGFQADKLVFTDSSSGILYTSGVLTYSISGAGSTVTWSDLLKAEGKVEDGLDTSNSKWYMRRETWFYLSTLTASGSGEYLFQPNPHNPTTPWGTPVQFVRVLPKHTEVGTNAGFMVYGDLKNVKFYSKRGLQIKMLDQAVVKDSTGSDFNLATQDAQAMRAVVRMLSIIPKGNANKLLVLGTGTVS